MTRGRATPVRDGRARAAVLKMVPRPRALMSGLAVSSVLLTAGAGGAQPIGPQPVTIYVYATPVPGGYVDATSKSRENAVAEVKESLGMSKSVRVVDRAEDATLQLELTNADRNEWTGTHLGATLMHGTYRLDLKAKDATMMFRRTARKMIAHQVIQWVKDNSSRLQDAAAH